MLVAVFSPFGIALNRKATRWYLEKNVANLNVIIPLRFLLLNVAMVPSTLKVTLELIKLLYTLFIHSDEHLFPSSHRLTSSKALQSDVRMNSCPPQASGNEVELRESCDVAPGGRREGASRALQQHLAL